MHRVRHDVERMDEGWWDAVRVAMRYTTIVIDTTGILLDTTQLSTDSTPAACSVVSIFTRDKWNG